MIPAGVDLRLAGADPHEPADRLAATDTGRLRAAAVQMAGIARVLVAAAGAGQPAVGQVVRGWSATGPALAITRLVWSTEQTAGLLAQQSTAIETACVLIDRAVSNAHWDVALAVAQLDHLHANAWEVAAGVLLGSPLIGSELRRFAIVRELRDALAARVAEVDSALEDLRAALAVDPTAGPDALRAGPAAVVPPDPALNPATRTDQRNRASLAADLRSDDPARIAFALSILQSLQRAGDRGGTAQLVVYDPTAFSGQGRAAISVGDLTTATDVAVLVPGIANSPSAMSGGIDLAADLRDEAGRQGVPHTAVVAWYGYDIPASFPQDPASSLWTDVHDTLAVGSAANAASGGSVLAADLTAVKAMSQSSARTTVLGFSMGSTTVSEAARFRLPVDAIVLLGSPGAGWSAPTAAAYPSVPADRVYVLSYDQDPVTRPIADQLAGRLLGIADPYGPDPATASFGATDIDASTNVPLVTGSGPVEALARALGDPRHHSMQNYMQGRALVAEGAIMTGRDARVPDKTRALKAPA